MSNVASCFDSAGYFRVRGTLPIDLLDRVEAVVDRDFRIGKTPHRVNARGGICRLDNLLQRDDVFLAALQESVVLEPLVQILGPVIEVVHNRHNHATLNNAGDIPFRLHRDIQQWSQPLVAVFIYLDEARIENGCTHVVPGSHRLPYVGPQSGGGGGNWADEHAEYRHLIGQELPVPMSRGGVLMLNCLCFHSVGKNTSKKSRRSMVFACRASDELTRIGGSDVTRVSGEKRFLANSALRVSGSLRQG